MEVNYSKSIRELFKNNVVVNKKYQKSVFPFLQEEHVNEVVFNTLSELILLKSSNVNENEEHTNRLISVYTTLFAIQMYTDLYKKLNYLNRISKIDAFDQYILENLKNVHSMDGLIELLKNDKIRRKLFYVVLEFNDLPVYEKLLQIKALSDNDRENLALMNPFFQGECATYDVEVNRAFLLRQIGKWQKQFSDNLDKSYIDATEFLMNYSLINYEDFYELTSSIIEEFGNKEENYEDYQDELKTALINFYLDSKAKKLTK